MKTAIIRALIDGAVQSVILFFQLLFLLSVYMENFSLPGIVVFAVIGATVALVLYGMFSFKESSNRLLLLFSLASLLFSVLTMLTLLLIHGFVIPLSIVPFRETNAADGLLLLFFLAIFCGTSMLFRVSVFCWRFIRNLGGK